LDYQLYLRVLEVQCDSESFQVNGTQKKEISSKDKEKEEIGIF